MRKDLIALPAGLALLLAAAAPAVAGARCGPRAEVIEMLGERYEETRRGMGMAGSTQVLEVFASQDGTWTVLVTDPEGRSCLVASGQAWEDLRETLPVQDEAA